MREAARTADRLFQRYATSGERGGAAGGGPAGAPASRELAARVALQLHNIRQGLDDIAVRAPVDALLSVEPSLEAGGDVQAASAWCGRLRGMYQGWAVRRRVQVGEIRGGSASAPILRFTGFGAFRTLRAEAGLHVLEEQQGDATTRRVVARVAVAAGLEQEPPPAARFGAAAKLLTDAPVGPTIVRRYRESPSPMVRDAARGWRTGRLDLVLGGDFDLIGAA